MKLFDGLFKDAPLATRGEISPKLGFVLTVLLAIIWLIRSCGWAWRRCAPPLTAST